jgi:hypothetical protein
MAKQVRTRHHVSHGLDNHVGYISGQLERSLEDGETKKLATKIVSGSYDYATDPRTGKSVPVVRAWGHNFRAPPEDGCKARDSACEIGRIWDFLVLNVRYTEDPLDADTFATLKETLLSGGGDCDDMVIGFGALLKSVGYPVAARVITTKDAPNEWVHIYPLAGCPKERPKNWIPLDITVNGAYPGWQYERIGKSRDYQM